MNGSCWSAARITLLMVALILVLAVPAVAETEPVSGGTLRVANALTPVHLDTDKTTDSAVGQMMFHVYEGLFEIDADYRPVPHLAASYQLEDDGRTYQVQLREDVIFHDGSLMTAADVVASFERYLSSNSGAQTLLAPYLDTVEQVDDFTVVFRFAEPHAPFLQVISSIVANQKFVVRPQALVEKFGDDVMTEHIGTGPFAFVDWVPDQYVRLERFDDYVPHPGPSFAYSGEKIAYVDQLEFRIVPEPAVRAAGVQTGEFHFADFVPRDQLPLFEALPQVEPYLVSPYRQAFIIVNMGHAPFDQRPVRQALLYSLDREALGYAMVGSDDFWLLNPSLFLPGHIWHVPEAGGGRYEAYDPEQARQLLAEAGYDGTPIVILNSREDDVASRGAIALKDQLEKAGFVVALELYDRATVVQRRARPDGYHLHLSQFYSPDPDPQVYGAWMGTNRWIGNWDDEDSRKMDDIFARMLTEPEYEARYAIVEEWHQAFYDYVPYVKLFDYKQLRIAHTRLQGYANFAFHTFFNVWLEP